MADEHPPGSARSIEPHTSLMAEISREMVRIYKDQLGRGPSKARSAFAGPDLLICTLEETFTPAELKMVELDEHHRLRDTRLFFQHATADEFVAAVEQVLGREVRGFISGVDTIEDISAEIFYLEPSPLSGT